MKAFKNMKLRKVSALFLPLFVFSAVFCSAPAQSETAKSPKVAVRPKKKEKPQQFPKFPRIHSKKNKEAAANSWINTAPLNSSYFKEKLTLVYFWDYTSINCIREFRFLQSWQERYKPYGFQILWIHAPEFAMGRDPKFIQSAISRFGISGPVYLDNDFKIWENLKVKSWPTKVLVDENGKVLMNRAGEGNYAEVESQIRSSLKNLDPNIVLPERNFKENLETYDFDKCGNMSSETYLGFKKSTWWGAKMSNQQYVVENETVNLKDYGERTDRGFFAEGLWTNREEFLEHARDTGTPYDYAGVVYQGREVYAVLHSTDPRQNARVYVTRDDKPVPQPYRGADMKVDEKGDTYIQATEPRLYYLIEGEDEDLHEIRLWTASKHVAISSFSFSNMCLADFEHR